MKRKIGLLLRLGAAGLLGWAAANAGNIAFGQVNLYQQPSPSPSPSPTPWPTPPPPSYEPGNGNTYSPNYRPNEMAIIVRPDQDWTDQPDNGNADPFPHGGTGPTFPVPPPAEPLLCQEFPEGLLPHLPPTEQPMCPVGSVPNDSGSCVYPA